MTLFDYIRRNCLSFIMVIIPASLFLAPLPLSPDVYYALLIILAGLAMIRAQRISYGALLLLVVCVFSIVFGNAAPLFKSWERLGLFALLLIGYFPVFQSSFFNRLRSKAFPIMLVVIILTSIGSFIGYFFGINYMERNGEILGIEDPAGWFGGLTYHSMMLSPICAITLSVLVWALTDWAKTKMEKIIIICAAFSTLCCMMLTASRGGNIAGIVGVISVLFLKYRNHIRKILQIGIIGLLLGGILSPVYMPYADMVLTKQRNNEAAGSTYASREGRWNHRLEEFAEYPIFGYGFSAIDTKNTGEYMASTGIVEPGSSWLAILSMTGLAGAICFLTILYSTISRLYRRFCDSADSFSLLHLGILTVFSVHFIVEGYVFAGGAALCFLFWFFFGCAYSYARSPIPYWNRMMVG